MIVLVLPFVLWPIIQRLYTKYRSIPTFYELCDAVSINSTKEEVKAKMGNLGFFENFQFIEEAKEDLTFFGPSLEVGKTGFERSTCTFSFKDGKLQKIYKKTIDVIQ